MSEINEFGSPAGSVESFSGKKIWVTGHRGMLGSAVVRSLVSEGAELLLTSRAELDLSNQGAVKTWMEKNRPELVFHVGAKVGGIHANATLPADFLRENPAPYSHYVLLDHQDWLAAHNPEALEEEWRLILENT